VMAHKGYSCDIKGCPETRSENQDRAVVRECEWDLCIGHIRVVKNLIDALEGPPSPLVSRGGHGGHGSGTGSGGTGSFSTPRRGHKTRRP
jgi:hypothetical protein